MASLQFWVVVFVTWQLTAARFLSSEDLSFDINKLSSEEAERLATWTEDSKQNIWELSGQFEGDMVLSMNQRNGLINTDYRWPNLEIPYELDSVFDASQQEWIHHSLSEYYNKTCIKPRLRNEKDTDYVYVTGASTGCHSHVGRQRGKQTLNLQPNAPGSGCLRLGTVVHEFLHALGFYHQQSSTDRDDFVEIVWENIQSGKEYNFNKYTSNVTTSFGEEYDYNSVMHYSSYAFSKNGEETIITKNSEAVIGQRNGLSDIDAAKLNKMYNCE